MRFTHGFAYKLPARRANKRLGIPGGKRRIALFKSDTDDSFLIVAAVGKNEACMRLSREALTGLCDLFDEHQGGRHQWKVLLRVADKDAAK